MAAQLDFHGPEQELEASDFLELAARVWPGDYSKKLTEQALSRTLNFTAWHGKRLVGCARLLTDGYFFSTIPEVLVDPAYQRQGVGAKLMQMAWQASPTSLGFGVQPGNEDFFESLEYEAKMQFYVKRKPRIRTDDD